MIGRDNETGTSCVSRHRVTIEGQFAEDTGRSWPAWRPSLVETKGAARRVKVAHLQAERLQITVMYTDKCSR